jgi:uncharacterized membrane protein
MPIAMISLMLLLGRGGIIHHQMAHSSDHAPLLQIVDERFAAGEITRNQYEAMKSVLLNKELPRG